MTELSRLRNRAVSAARERTAAALRDTVRSARAAGAWLRARRPPGPRAVAIAFAATAAALSAWAILVQARLPARLPSALDWAAARALVERDARPGDAVVLSPAWAERARELLPPTVPVFALRRYVGEDLIGVRRVWLLSLHDAPGFSWGAEVDLVARAARAGPAERLGGIDVSRHELAHPTLPLAFLPDRIGEAEVRLGDERCAADGIVGFSCAGGTARVDRAVREVAGAPRPCLLAAASSPLAAALRVAFPPMRLGRTFHGHAGAAGPGGGAPVRIAVELDGQEVGAAEVSGAGFPRFEIDMTRVAGQTRALSLVLTSPEAFGSLCVEASILP